MWASIICEIALVAVCNNAMTVIKIDWNNVDINKRQKNRRRFAHFTLFNYHGRLLYGIVVASAQMNRNQTIGSIDSSHFIHTQ